MKISQLWRYMYHLNKTETTTWDVRVVRRGMRIIVKDFYTTPVIQDRPSRPREAKS